MQEAVKHARETFERSQEVLGASHLDALLYANNLAIMLADQGRLPEAEELLRTTLDGLRSTGGEKHPRTLAAALNLQDVVSQGGAGALSGEDAALAERAAAQLTRTVGAVSQPALRPRLRKHAAASASTSSTIFQQDGQL